MIPLTTKLTAICSLLQRVLEMEEKATPGPWEACGGFTPAYAAINSKDGYIVFGMADRNGDLENGELIEAPDYEYQRANLALIAFSRNITKPQATALLGDIQNFTFLLSPCFGDKTNAFAQAALQSIADAFPDALFQDSSRCA